MPSKKKEISLFKVILFLFIGLACVYAAMTWSPHFSSIAPQNTSSENVREIINAAFQLIDQGNPEEAEKKIAPLVTRALQTRSSFDLDTFLLLAEVEKVRGNTDKTAEILQTALDRFPNDPGKPKATVELATVLTSQNKLEEALSLLRGVVESSPAEYRAPALLEMGKIAERKGNQIEARDYYKRACSEAAWGSETWEKAADELGRINVALIFSSEPTPESMVYTVEKGDSLVSIGVKLNTTLGLLTRANGLSENSVLSVGQRLKYTPKDFHIFIERSTCTLYLMDKDGLFKRYKVGLGMPGHETALGKYKIGNKQKDPTWFKPGAGEIPAGDPANELGTRWMPLIPLEDSLPTDLGIHGTIRPETVGGYYSQGCARLKNEDVEELYDLVVRSTPVDIVETFKPVAP